MNSLTQMARSIALAVQRRQDVEPIVNMPEDASRCFMGSDLDLLANDSGVLINSAENPGLGLD